MSHRETIARFMLSKCLTTQSPLYILRWIVGVDWNRATGKMANPAPLTEPPVSRELAQEEWAAFDATWGAKIASLMAQVGSVEKVRQEVGVPSFTSFLNLKP